MDFDEEWIPMKDPKYCFVPDCSNNSRKNPDKHFFTVPKSNKKEWCDAVGIGCPIRRLIVCEDHLNLKEDIQNYQYWEINKTRAKLKPQVPAAFLSTCRVTHQDICSPISGTSTMKTTVDVGTSYQNTVKSKAIQVKPNMADRTTQCSVPIRKNDHFNDNWQIDIIDDSEDTMPSSQGTMPSSQSTFASFSSESTGTFQSQVSEKQTNGKEFMLSLIQKDPETYIGLPKIYFWLVECLSQNLKVKQDHIFITLYKIKNNVSLKQISDMFNASLTTLWRCFVKTLCSLAKFFKKLIFCPNKSAIKKHLPSTFKTNKDYSNVFCIIDCFEIQIEKPSDPINQALTWSQYKSANTVKYLVAITPDGFIMYVSDGYGGRTTDVNIVESCGFLDILPGNSTILADRGFKHLEVTLNRKHIQMLRPPSVSANAKLSKADAIQSKVIASLRIHVERVIRRIRLYKFLKPHAVINNKLVQYTDEAVIVACGLINLQNPIIKSD